MLDAESGSKGARFVRTCNAFGLPLVVLVDTPGLHARHAQEQGGVIRHGAKLVHAFAEAEVPKVTVVLRKAFGGAFIAMNSRDLGADYAFAWPQAQLGVMGAKQAVGIVNRRDIAAAEDPETAREEFAAALHGGAPQRRHRRGRGLRRRGHRPARHPPPADRSPDHPRRRGPTGRRSGTSP